MIASNIMRYRICLATLIAQTLFFSVSVRAQEDNQPPTGFTALFNGRDFDDWSGGATRDPREIAAMSESDRAAHHTEMKRRLKDHWRVEDGALVSDGEEPYLATT